MIVAGVMSGTSADGIDVAFARITGASTTLRVRFLGHWRTAYPRSVRNTILRMMNAHAESVAELSRLDFLLGELYADAVSHARSRLGITKLALVGCHGQTLYHQGNSARFLGRSLRATWQIGEGAVLAARLKLPVVSDFRPADLAAGGQGAPLVPLLDYVVYRHARRGRILQNLGGIGNLTAIPAGAERNRVVAFDTGPGNMLIDACMQQLYRRPYDRDGAIAAGGEPDQDVIPQLLRAAYFRLPPPKTAGREQFGREYASAFLRRLKGARKADVIATATALTARSIGVALKQIARRGPFHDYVVAGGGVNNKTLMRMIDAELVPYSLRLRSSGEFGIPPEAKEAVAFALLAYCTWNKLPGNLPAATGAHRAAALGKISHA